MSTQPAGAVLFDIDGQHMTDALAYALANRRLAPGAAIGMDFGRTPDATAVYLIAPNGVPVAALADVLAMRHTQIHKHGHTAQADMARPIADMVKAAERYMAALREDVTFRAPLENQRKHTVALAALCLALIERIDGEAVRHG